MLTTGPVETSYGYRRTLSEWISDCINVVALGAVGDGSTDDTAAFTAARDLGASTGKPIYVPGGRTYMVSRIYCDQTVHWRLDPTAVVKMNSAYSGLNALFYFSHNAPGSSLIGGILDGNRAALKASFANPDWIWSGFIAINTDDFYARDIVCRNFVSFGWWVQGYRTKVDSISVRTCGKGSQIKDSYYATFSNLSFDDCGNDGVNTYQHCNEWRDMYDVAITNVSVTNFHPDATGREVKPCAITTETSSRVALSNVNIDGYTGVSASNLCVGLQCDTTHHFNVTGLTVANGYCDGIILQSCDDVAVSNFTLDGGYTTYADVGITVTNTGLVKSPNGLLDYNGKENSTSRNCSFSNGVIKRFSVGVQSSGNDTRFTDLRVIGNLTYGVREIQSTTNAYFPGQAPQGAQRNKYSACTIAFNGSCGVSAESYDRARFSECDVINNGQDKTLSDTYFTGFVANLAAGKRLMVNDCRLGDTQSFTMSVSASFIPGSTDGNNQFRLYLPNPGDLTVGQWIVAKNATGAADITAKIVDIQEDYITVQTTSAKTFSATGNTTALTGTVTVSNLNVTGSGTAFLTEVTGFCIMKVGSTYALVRRVDSNTALIFETAPGDVSGASASLVLIDIQGIQSQRHAFYIGSSVTGPIVPTRNNYEGLTGNPSVFTDYFKFGPEAEICVGTDTPMSVSTSGNITDVLTGIPLRFMLIAGRVQVTEDILGVDSTFINFEFRDGSVGTGVLYTFATNTTYTAGVVGYGTGNGQAVKSSGGNLSVRLSDGTDNTPSSGKVMGQALVGYPQFGTSF